MPAGRAVGCPLQTFLKSRARDTIHMVSRAAFRPSPRNAPYIGALRPLAP